MEYWRVLHHLYHHAGNAAPDYATREYLFATFLNETGWPDGIAWLLGLLQGGLGLTGSDAGWDPDCLEYSILTSKATRTSFQILVWARIGGQHYRIGVHDNHHHTF